MLLYVITQLISRVLCPPVTWEGYTALLLFVNRAQDGVTRGRWLRVGQAGSNTWQMSKHWLHNGQLLHASPLYKARRRVLSCCSRGEGVRGNCVWWTNGLGYDFRISVWCENGVVRWKWCCLRRERMFDDISVWRWKCSFVVWWGLMLCVIGKLCGVKNCAFPSS